jgi:hypothetical protein
MRSALALLAASVLCLSGCSSPNAAGPGPTPNTLAGNWSFAGTATTGPNLQIGAYVMNSSGAVTGTMHVTNNTSCYPITTGAPVDVPFTGTFNSTTDAISMTSSAVSSQVITINGTTNSSTNTLASGTYSIAGGCANGDAGTITGNQDSSLTNNYSGSLTTPAVTFTAPLFEQGPDTHGNFSLSVISPASINFSTNACFTFGLPNGATYVTGNYVYITMINNDNSTLTFTGAATDNTGKTITGTYTISGGTGGCNGDSGTLTMTHP